MAQLRTPEKHDKRGEQVTWETSGSRLRQDQLFLIYEQIISENRWSNLIPHLRNYNGQPYSDQQNLVFQITEGKALLNVWLTEIPTLMTMYRTFSLARLQGLCEILVNIVGYKPMPESTDTFSFRQSPSLQEPVEAQSCASSQHDSGATLLLEDSCHNQGSNSQDLTASRLSWQSPEQVRELTNNFDERQIIGRGNFGTVYRGKKSSNGQMYAIKRLTGGNRQLEFTHATTDFYLENDHVVRLLATSTYNDEYFLIYEYLAKLDLHRHLSVEDLKQQLSCQRRFVIAQDVIKGLSFINNIKKPDGKCLVHRDIKCANIFLDNHFRAKIGDFGASTTAIRGTGNTEIQYAGMVIGTPGYLAPELKSPTNPNISTKVDTYAYGVVIFELCLGKLVNDYPELVQNIQQYSGSVEPDSCIRWDAQIGKSNIQVFEFLLMIGKQCTMYDWVRRPLTVDVEKKFMNILSSP